MSEAHQVCFHCGESVDPADRDPIRYPIHYAKAQQACCCAGCQAIAQTIMDAGLADYYEQRTQPAGRAGALPQTLLEQLALFDVPELQAGFVKIEANQLREAALIIEGISCAACIWLIERALLKCPGVLDVQINYTSHRARLRWDSSRQQLSQILLAVARLGYQAHPYDPGRQELIRQQERKSAINRLWIAGLSMMQVMMYAVPVYMAGNEEIPPNMLALMHWASLILTLPVLLYSCQTFHQGAWRDLKRGRVGMDVPVVLGVWAAFTASCWSLLQGQGAVYFDSVAMFVFLLLGGRYLEGMARQRAGAAAESLIKLIPAVAHLLRGWPAQRVIEDVAVARLQLGDVVLVKPGEHFPADGRVVEGEGEADEALLTGESRPQPKGLGGSVTGGSVNGSSPLLMQVERLGQDTQLAAIVRLLDRALAEKPQLALLAEQVAGWFVLVLLLVAGGGWLWWDAHDPTQALPVLVAVLVVSCPCALSLATPAALTAATGRLAQLGILLSRGHALESLAQIDTIVFDKTGTLSLGHPSLLALLPLALDEAQARTLAALLEGASEHPIGKALRSGQEVAGTAQDYQNFPGAGVSAVVAGQRYYLGRADFIAQHCSQGQPAQTVDWQSEHSVVWLASSTEWLAGFALGDAVRPDAQASLAALPKHLQLHLLSGDAPGPVHKMAQALGIKHVQAGATPAAKMAYVQALQQQGRRVLMVGDGINDAPVLALADVSLAVSGGAEAAQAAADLLLVGKLTALAEGLALARKTRRIIWQNLAWAVGYNLLALPLALMGWITPWLASLGMASSSLLVVLSALRLTRKVREVR